MLELPDLVVHGELVVLDSQGRPDFDALRRRLALKRPMAIEHAAKTTPAAIFAFDLLELDGKDVRQMPLLKRKALLKEQLHRYTASDTWLTSARTATVYSRSRSPWP